jgi:hypothetical protein
MFYDYFRASDAVISALIDGSEWMGPLLPPEVGEPVDAVDAKWIEPQVTLGRLVGFVQGVPWRVDLMEVTSIDPDEDADADAGLLQIGDAARDALAGVTADQGPDLVARWVVIEEFRGHGDADYLAAVLTGLADLSQRARAAGQHLLCRWSQ